MRAVRSRRTASLLRRWAPVAATLAGAGAYTYVLARLIRRRGARPFVGGDLDTSWWSDRRRSWGPPIYRGMNVSSHYLTMRDGVRIAVDLYLPQGLPADARLPALVLQTRYYRSIALHWPFSLLFRYMPFPAAATYRTIQRFVTRGYAWVSVDARGSGASFGTRSQELSPDEVQDGVEVVDWVVSQPWSNGRVGTTGISYEGIAAEFLAASGHPAIKATAPRFALFDSFADVGFPGGIHHRRFTELWGHFNNVLDAGRLRELPGRIGTLLGLGVQPVGDDLDLLLQAIDEHAGNFDVHSQATGVVYRDERSDTGVTADAMSTWTRAADLEASGMPVYSYSGWQDSAFVRSAISRFLTVRTPGSRLTLGPWPHGIGQNSSPYAARRHTVFDHDGELLRFFDYHLRGRETGIAEEPPVHYFTIGANTWHAAACWPPPAESRRFYFAPGHALSASPPAADEASDAYQVDFEVGTGLNARWDPLVGAGSVHYHDRVAADRRLLVYDSGPLRDDTEVTGHPIVTLYVTSGATDGSFFVYLEDVDPRGRIVYVTEGMLRALHRKLSDAPPYRTPVPYHSFAMADAEPLVPGEVAELVFDLLPISYLFRRGHRIRVAVAGADRDHFEPVPEDPPLIHVFRDAAHPSHVTLPVVARKR